MLSGVTPFIDVWSFGCVLSVAATWVVLGFKGVRQYERLRQLSPTNMKDNITYDRFHDGIQALPEIGKWHDYLRGHMRPSDTTTPLVLDLIEYDMLQMDPSRRPDLKTLCEKLEEIVGWASEKIKSLKKSSRETDAVVLQALLKIEEQAQNQKSSEPQKRPLQQQSIVGVHKDHPRTRASRQIPKGNKPLGQTAHRKEILQNELNSNIIVREDGEQRVSGTHNGAVTDSPIDEEAQLDATLMDRPGNPRKPKAIHHYELLPAHTDNVRPPRVTAATKTAREYAQNWMHPSPIQSPSLDEHKAINGLQPRFSDDLHSSPESIRSGPQTMVMPESPSSRNLTYLPRRAYPADPFSPGAENFFTPDLHSPGAYTSSLSNTSPTSAYYTPTIISGPEFTQFSVPSMTNTPKRSRQYGDSVPQLSPPNPSPSGISDRQLYRPSHRTSAPAEPPQTPGLSITLSQPGELPSRIGAMRPLPSSVYELPFDICRRRSELDQEVPKGIAKFKGYLGRETRNKDISLEHTFRERREIVSLSDYQRNKSADIIRSSSLTTVGQCSNTGQLLCSLQRHSRKMPLD